MKQKLLDSKKILLKIKHLEEELASLRASLPETKTVQVPEHFKPIFDEAQKTVKEYFSNLKLNPEKGTIEISDQRYVLVRASALSNEFFDNIKELYWEKTEEESFNIASNFLFDVGHAIGVQDARNFHKKMNLQDPISKMSAGPVHFAYSGWAFVDILNESSPSPDENFFIKYHHPYSFEADSWIKSGKKSDKAVCTMNAAYSSGWCSESFGIPLTAVEISCRAKGDENCTFIMAHPDKIQSFLDEERKNDNLHLIPQIPFFFERKIIEEKLHKNEQMLNSAQKISKLGSFEFTLATQNLLWSAELFNIYGIDPNIDKNDLYSTYLSRFLDSDISQLNKYVELAVTKGQQYSFTHGIQLPNNVKKWISCTGIPIKDEKGNVIKIIGYAQDITDKINTEKELNEFFRLSMDLLCIANMDGHFVKMSYGWLKKTGYSLKKLISTPFMEFFHKDDFERTVLEFEKVKNGGYATGFENRFRCKNGKYITLSWNSSPDGVTGLVYCIARDVTEEKEAEEKLIATLREKEVLLKEVHHRVKNNLQIISSLLNLQTNYIENELTKSLYKESQNRIKSIAAIHELLYRSIDFGKINFNDYLSKLTSDLCHSHYGNNNNVEIEINTQEEFNVDTSVPLGLLVNEIISNSLKHGLKNEKGDLIKISIQNICDDKFELDISDNGLGYQEDNSGNKQITLGLMLINELSSQLNGEIKKIYSKKGTNYQLIFTEN